MSNKVLITNSQKAIKVPSGLRILIRRACNAVRTARNEAAHATDHTDAAQAAILFNEAIECLEDAYAGTAFRENELARYYRQAEEFLSRCGAREPVASSRAPAEEKPAARSTSRQSTRQSQSRKTGSSRSSGKRTAAHSNSGRSSSAKGRGNTNCKKKRKNSGNQTVMIVLLAALVLGLLVRAWSMGAV